MKWLRAAWKDPVGSKVIAAAILLASSTISAPVRRWVFEGLGNISRAQVIVWFFFGVVFGAAICYASMRRRLPKQADRKRTEDARKTTMPAAAPRFSPITVLDQTLGIEWEIRKAPLEWIEDHKLRQHSPVLHEAILAGPFHSVSGCKADLSETEWEEGTPKLMQWCAGCDGAVYRSSEQASIRAIREQTLTELQRMARNGARIEGTVVLERPEYWKWMKPAQALPA